MSPRERVSQAVAASLHISVRTAHELRRWWRWFFAPLCDDWRGLSLNRFLAVLFGVAASIGALQKPKTPLTGWDIAAMGIAGSLAFGKDVWLAYIYRKKEEKPDA